MGGHGGLNILPQKRWNVYNFDNREKVKKDEEEAAKEEQIKQDQSRKRQSELRLQQLRQSKNPNPIQQLNVDEIAAAPAAVAVVVEEEEEEKSKPQDSKHVNLFEGIRIFDPVKIGGKDEKKGKFWRESKKVKKEEVRVVGPEDEVYRVGYGVVGKGVKLPWYLENKKNGKSESDDESERVRKKRKVVGGKKSLEELREERVTREHAEKERERALVARKTGGFSSRRR